MSLSDAEKNLVRNTWALSRQDVQGNGSDLFIRFFQENPTYQAYFKAFSKVDNLDELKTNKKFKAHVTNVMYSLSMLVDNLDDTDVLVEMLAKMAENHVRHRVTIDMFANLKTSLFGLLNDKLGPKVMTPETVTAWDKTYGIIMTVVQPLL